MAQAILEATRRANLPLERLEVWPDDASRTWIVVATVGKRENRLSFPFASPAGIYTPSEIAAHFVSNSWPFA